MPVSTPVASARPKSKQALNCSFAAFFVLVASQIATPLADSALNALTSIVVLTLVLLSVSLATFGQEVKKLFRIFVLAYVFAFFVEVLGHKSGFPFGPYDYGEALKPQLLGVPLIIPAAWFAMGLPAWEISNRLVTNRWLRAGVGGLLMAAWDLMLDPQMVTNGFWTWEVDGFWYGIPLSNFVGWTAVGAVLTFLIGTQLDSNRPNPFLVLPYIWMGAFSALGFLLPFVFDIPWIGFVGGIAMLTPALLALRKYERPWLR